MKARLNKASKQFGSIPASAYNSRNHAATKLVDNRSNTAIQLQLIDCITNSPQAVAQRQKIDQSFGGAIQRAVDIEFDDTKSDDEDGHEYNNSSKERWPVNGELTGKAKSDFEKSIVGNEKLKHIYYGSDETIQTKAIKKHGIVQRLTDEKYVNTQNYGSAYYQYDYDGSGNIDDFSNNRATTGPIGANPVIGPVVDLDEGVGNNEGEMRSGKIVDITSSSRSRHFSIADRIIDGTPADRKGKYTWHHLTPEYKMVRVDMNVHLGSRGGFPHKGGKSFWT